MCGVWFSVGFEPSREVIDVIKHRGPDGEGWETFSSPQGLVTLGHRRLAIIDTSDHALQPMYHQASGNWIVYNGEIYNYKELHQELIKAGHQFYTQSDTEVVLAAFAEWGKDCLHKFSGMFAFIIYNPASHQFFAARDPFGIKPLYFYFAENTVSFASEIKQFTKIPFFRPHLNRPRAYDFLAHGIFNHTNETLFSGISQLRGGEFITSDLNVPLSAPQPQRWYQLPEPYSLTLSEEEATKDFKSLFLKSIQLHLRSDVQVGSCLSGGLDSSSIVCVASSFLKETEAAPLHTVSSCYEIKAVDERPYIEAVLQQTHAHRSYVFPQPEDLEKAIQKITWHQDEPFGSTSIFAQWCVFQEAHAQGLKVMLDGQGADEQLAGYQGLLRHHLKQLYREKRYVKLFITTLDCLFHHFSTCFNLLKRRFFRSSSVLNFLKPAAFHLPKHDNVYDKIRQQNCLGPFEDLGHFCHAMVVAASLPMLLHYEDRSSMAFSVEARVPFLSPKLVELSIGLGNRFKYKGALTKWILRKALQDFLPSKIYKRRSKLGFATPEEAWFRGPLREKIREWSEETLKIAPDFFNENAVRKLRDDMLAEKKPVDFTLWRLVSFGMWLKIFHVKID